jgi:CheY-like chemotaxis protein
VEHNGNLETTPQETNEPINQLPQASKTIMLVEDEDSVRALSRLILEREGYTIIEARDGKEALLMCEQYPGKIDLLLTDVVMPYLGGPELAEQVILLRPGIKVVYLSGYTDKAIVQQGLLREGVAYLEKPFTPQTLVRRLRQVLE